MPPALFFILAILTSQFAYAWPERSNPETSIQPSVRRMQPVDVHAASSITPEWPKERLLAYVNPYASTQPAYVCEINGKIVGILFYQSRRDSFLVTEIHVAAGVDKIPVYSAFVGAFRGRLGLRRSKLRIAPGAVPETYKADFQELGLDYLSNSALVLDFLRDSRIAFQAEQIRRNRDSSDLYVRLGLDRKAGKRELSDTRRAIRRSGMQADPKIVQAWNTLSDEIKRAKYDYESQKAKSDEQLLKDSIRHIYLPQHMDPYHMLGLQKDEWTTSDEVVDAFLRLHAALGDDGEAKTHAFNAMKILLSPAATDKLHEMMSATDPVAALRAGFDAVVALAERDFQRERERIAERAKRQLSAPNFTAADTRPSSDRLHERLGLPETASEVEIFNRFIELKSLRARFTDEQWAKIREAFWILADSQRRHNYDRGYSVSSLLEYNKSIADVSSDRPVPVLGTADPDEEVLYARLGLPANAQTELIERTYEELEKNHLKDWTPQQWKRVREAVLVLTHPDSRKTYDRHFTSGIGRPTEEDVHRIIEARLEDDLVQDMLRILATAQEKSAVQLRDVLVPLLRETKVPMLVAKEVLQELNMRGAHIDRADDASALSDIVFALDKALETHAVQNPFRKEVEQVRHLIEENSAPFKRPELDPSLTEALRAFMRLCDSHRKPELN